MTMSHDRERVNGVRAFVLCIISFRWARDLRFGLLIELG